MKCFHGRFIRYVGVFSKKTWLLPGIREILFDLEVVLFKPKPEGWEDQPSKDGNGKRTADGWNSTWKPKSREDIHSPEFSRKWKTVQYRVLEGQQHTQDWKGWQGWDEKACKPSWGIWALMLLGKTFYPHFAFFFFSKHSTISVTWPVGSLTRYDYRQSSGLSISLFSKGLMWFILRKGFPLIPLI